MAAANLEPLSPELVLVCPELREYALAMLPTFAWHAPAAETRVPPKPMPQLAIGLQFLRSAATSRLAPLWVATTAMLCCALATLALTLIADALR
jgi:hypothetical protein